MSIAIENESPLPIVLTDVDPLAVGIEEGTLPTMLDYCRVVQQRASFIEQLDWRGGVKDRIREIDSGKPDRAVVLAVHVRPGFMSCEPEELGEPWSGMEPLSRITTLTYEEGDIDYIQEGDQLKGVNKWLKQRPWCGQTVLTFPREKIKESLPKPKVPNSSSCNLLVSENRRRALSAVRQD